MEKIYRKSIARDEKTIKFNQLIFISRKARDYLTKSEKVLLDEIFEFAYSLETGKRKPQTEKEKNFVMVCRGQLAPQNAYQNAYLKYLKLRNHFLHQANIKDIKDNEQTIENKNHDNNVKEKNISKQEKESASMRKKRENAEAATRIATRKMRREKNYCDSSIPEYEEGTPRHGWFTDDDCEKMKKQDYADMKSHHRE